MKNIEFLTKQLEKVIAELKILEIKIVQLQKEFNTKNYFSFDDGFTSNWKESKKIKKYVQFNPDGTVEGSFLAEKLGPTWQDFNGPYRLTYDNSYIDFEKIDNDYDRIIVEELLRIDAYIATRIK